MSSILDALKKVEQEKAEANGAEEKPFSHETAEQDLLGDRPTRAGTLSRLSPVFIAVAGIVLVGVVVAVSVSVAILLTRPAASPTQVAQQTLAPAIQPAVPLVSHPAPQPQPTASPTEPVTPPAPTPQPAPQVVVAAVPPPAPQSPAPPAAPPAPAPVTTLSPQTPQQPLEVPAIAKSEEPLPETTGVRTKVAKRTEKPKPGVMRLGEAPVQSVPPEGASEPSAEPKATPARAPIPVDLLTLPVLKESDKERLGLGDIRINMVRPANRAHPYASAIINLQPVHIGEHIPDTAAVLIGVDTRAVAIEIRSSGERFHIRF